MPAEAHALGAKWLLHLTAMKTVVGTVLLDVHQQGSPTPEPWSYKEPHSRSLSRSRTFSSRPLRVKLMAHNGLFRPIPYLMTASTGPAPSLQRPLEAQLLPPSLLSRPRTFSSRPHQAQLLPLISLPRASFCFTATFQNSAPVLQWPFETHLLSPGGLYGPSSCRTTASLVPPAPASGRPIQAQNVHKSAPQGPAPAFRQPLQAQLLPPGGLYRPNSFSWLCLEAQLLPHNNLFWLSSCPAPGGLCRPNSCFTTTFYGSAPAQLLPAFVGPKLPQVKLFRPTFCLAVACTDPTLA
uniref:DUF4705 domain-containing protein n=1 Tax=Papio anubis TaxID=9555 RepID=A0A8I5N6W7_PAPAN